MCAQKKGERVHWLAFDLILNAVTLFCVMDGTKTFHSKIRSKLVKICHFHLTTAGFWVVSTDDDETARANEGRRVSSKIPLLARAFEDVTSTETVEKQFNSLVKS